MGKILETLGEYFFGTKQKKYYKQQINHAKEFARSEADLKQRLKYLKREQRVDIFFGKTLPNFIDAGGIFISFATKEPSIYLLVGEFFRNYWSFFITRPRQKTREKLKNLEIKTYRAGERAEEHYKNLSKDKPSKLDDILDGFEEPDSDST